MTGLRRRLRDAEHRLRAMAIRRQTLGELPSHEQLWGALAAYHAAARAVRRAPASPGIPIP